MIFTGRSGYEICAGAAVTPKARATNVAAILASERQNRSIVFPPAKLAVTTGAFSPDPLCGMAQTAATPAAPGFSGIT
jgi:hypothetical protein